MKLSRRERAVVQAVRGEDADALDVAGADDWRTFGNLDRTRLCEIVAEHAGYVKNDSVSRLPSVDDLMDFLEEFPFFRAHGFLHNLSVETPVEVYITGIEFIPMQGLPLASFYNEDLRDMKRRFLNLFYDADYIHVEDFTIVAEYYFERLLEVES